MFPPGLRFWPSSAIWAGISQGTHEFKRLTVGYPNTHSGDPYRYFFIDHSVRRINVIDHRRWERRVVEPGRPVEKEDHGHCEHCISGPPPVAVEHQPASRHYERRVNPDAGAKLSHERHFELLHCRLARASCVEQVREPDIQSYQHVFNVQLWQFAANRPVEQQQPEQQEKNVEHRARQEVAHAAAAHRPEPATTTSIATG